MENSLPSSIASSRNKHTNAPPLLLDDLRASFSMWRLWMTLGWRDIKARYRRTALGSFWTVMSVAVLVGSLGSVYSLLWGIDPRVFLPYFSAGFLSWSFVLTNTTEGCQTLIQGNTVIKTMQLPYTIHIFQMLWRNTLVFFNGLIVHIVVLTIFLISPTVYTPLFLVGLLITIVNLSWVSFILAMLTTRFRDVAQTITSIMQVMFFVTPIFWQPQQISGRPIAEMILIHLNPMFHLIDVLRSPLIGQMPRMESYAFLIVMAVAGWLLTAYLSSKFLKRVSYWL